MLGKNIAVALGVMLIAAGAARTLQHRAAETVAMKKAPAPQRTAAVAAPVRANLPVRRGELRIPPDMRGHFMTDAEINGSRISGMLVDTGATTVVLSSEDASAIGVYPAQDDFKYTASTANGVARLAYVKLNEVRIGDLRVYDVDALIGERGALNTSLLGMTFLSKLSRFAVEDGALVLKQ